MTFKKTDIINYLIDCFGYSEDDLIDNTKTQLLDMVEDKFELSLFINS